MKSSEMLPQKKVKASTKHRRLKSAANIKMKQPAKNLEIK